MTTTFAEALARLDADIEAAESRLSELRGKRDGVKAFVSDYMGIPYLPASGPGGAENSMVIRVSGSGQSAILQEIIARRIESNFTIEGLDQIAQSEGHNLTREQINNAVTYLRRRGFVEKQPGRGNWRRALPTDTNGTAEAMPFDQAPSPSGAGAVTS